MIETLILASVAYVDVWKVTCEKSNTELTCFKYTEERKPMKCVEYQLPGPAVFSKDPNTGNINGIAILPKFLNFEKHGCSVEHERQLLR